MIDVVALVPYRADVGGYRRRNALIVLHWLAGAGLPTLLIEHADAPDQLLTLPPTAARLHIAAEGRPFSKALACNTGFRVTDASIIALVDADTLMPMDAFTECIDAVRDGLDVVRPYGRLIELDEHTTAGIAAGAALPEVGSGDRDDSRAGEHIPLCGGLAIVQASAYRAVGGMDESFQGWGGEDDALSIALLRRGLACGINEPAVAFHLDHPRTLESRYGHPHYASNRARAQWWHEASEEELAAAMLAAAESLNRHQR